MVVLSDGTKVWLNAGSKLRYPVNFLSDSRDVYLEGEAYFNVTKKLQQKFVVHTSEIKIKVYGTEFNVKAYPDEKIIQTTLVHGAITIEGDDGKKNLLASPILLKPNQLATFDKTYSNELSIQETKSDAKQITHKEYIPQNKTLASVSPIVIIPKIDPVIYTSWKESNWIIKGEELESLAIKLERRYDVKIIIKGATLKKYKFSGTLRDETLQQVLDIIKIIAPIKYSIDKKNVVFEENASFVKSYDEMLINRK
jgi:ferric-dicitrate binding protein FerR (iron transport regulator)